MNVLQHTRNELNLCLKKNRPDRSYRDTLLILEKVSKFSDQFSGPGKSFKRKDEVYKSGGKIGFLKKTALIGLKKF